MKFEERVWKLMEKIPRGKVATYGLLAKKLDTEAYRAVATLVAGIRMLRESFVIAL